jgi:membrane associated rhomboid family serine protease
MANPYRTRFSDSPLMGGITPAVKTLLIVNTAIFLLCFLFRGLDITLVTWFGLIPASVAHLAVWQLFTYMFLHSTSGFGHILMNMLTLWMFGTPLESVWGTRRFLRFYFFCGIGAGVTVVLLNYLLPGGRPDVPTIGASGALYGLLLAFGLVFPDARILFFFLFPIPARVYVWLMAGILLLTTWSSGMGGTVSNVAHLGGMACGWIYLRMGLDRVRGLSFSPMASFDAWYKEWKLKRAKRKFQVYLKKHGGQPRDDRWTN